MARPDVALNGRERTVDLRVIFDGKLVKVDEEVLEFFGIPERGIISFTEPSNFHANWERYPEDSRFNHISQDIALGVLQSLDNVRDHLTISSEEHEMNLVFGVIRGNRVLYLEHENEEGGEEEYHLHCTPSAQYALKVKENRRYLQQTF